MNGDSTRRGLAGAGRRIPEWGLPMVSAGHSCLGGQQPGQFAGCLSHGRVRRPRLPPHPEVLGGRRVYSVAADLTPRETASDVSWCQSHSPCLYL